MAVIKRKFRNHRDCLQEDANPEQPGRGGRGSKVKGHATQKRLHCYIKLQE